MPRKQVIFAEENICTTQDTYMYENLLRLPYFQGMSKNELTSILDKVKMEFTRHEDGEKIITQGERCNSFVILTQGRMTAEAASSEGGGYKLLEECEAPCAIEPYSLFGSSQEYRRSYRAKGTCRMLTIDKSYFYSDFTKYNIFFINLLNLISRKTQFQSNLIWKCIPESIEGRIVRFIALRSESIRGEKTLLIKMEQLARQLAETRINISRALNRMQQQGLITLSRKEIHIPSFEKLLHTMCPPDITA